MPHFAADIAPPRFGSKTRINEFFHLDETSIQKWGIDPEFCLPLIKSPGDSDTITVDPASLGLKVFVCRKSKDDLQAEGKLGTLRYIEWGEQQEYQAGPQRGMKWPDGPWVRERKPGWYALPESETHTAQLFIASAYGDRHIHRFSPWPLIADKRLYFLSPVSGIPHALAAAIMNSSLVALGTEVAGRVTLGDGALELTVEDARDYLRVPDVRRFDPRSRQAILSAFEPLLKRPIGSVFEEVKRPGRQALDRAVLEAMGLDAAEWLPRIYEGLTTLVRERTELGRMRSKARKSKATRATGRLAEEVLADLLPAGPRRFPDDFWSEAARQGAFTVVPLPRAPLRYAGHLFGREEVVADGGFQYQAHSKAEAKYLLYAQAAGQEVARLPAQPVELSRTVADYEQYVRQTREALYDAYYRRSLDQKVAKRLAERAMQQLKLMLLESA